MKFGELVRQTRKEQDASVGAIAKSLGCSPQYLYDVESNNRKPSQRVVFELCELLEIPLWKGYATAGVFPGDLSKYLEEVPEAFEFLWELAEREYTAEQIHTLIEAEWG